MDKNKAVLNHALLEMISKKKEGREVDKLVKVCFVGDSNVGKTSIIRRMKGEEYWEDTEPTIGKTYNKCRY